MNLRQLVLGELDTNCYIVWDEAGNALIIDPADQPEEILTVVREHHLTVTAVVLTHVHFDHMLATEAVCAATGAPLYVGAGDEPALSDPIRNLSGLFTPGHPITINPDRVLKEGETLAVGTLHFAIMETPGHTPGCICLLAGDTLFSGDTLFYDSIGRIDFPGGDQAAMLRSLRRLSALDPTIRVYSGHGPATTIGRETAYNPYLNDKE